MKLLPLIALILSLIVITVAWGQEEDEIQYSYQAVTKDFEANRRDEITVEQKALVTVRTRYSVHYLQIQIDHVHNQINALFEQLKKLKELKVEVEKAAATVKLKGDGGNS